LETAAGSSCAGNMSNLFNMKSLFSEHHVLEMREIEQSYPSGDIIREKKFKEDSLYVLFTSN
jgi:hypothetical protein